MTQTESQVVTATIQPGGILALPADVMERAFLYAGDEVDLIVNEDGTLTIGLTGRQIGPYRWEDVAEPRAERPPGEETTGVIYTDEEFEAHLEALAAEAEAEADARAHA